jgi:Mrp family chromosome partitioning ATPase
LQLHDALKSLSAEFDYIVVNSPPMSRFVDAAILSHVADKILLVIRWKDTPQEIVQRAARQLFGVNARVGVVLNLIHPGQASKYDRHAYVQLRSAFQGRGEAAYRTRALFSGSPAPGSNGRMDLAARPPYEVVSSEDPRPSAVTGKANGDATAMPLG